MGLGRWIADKAQRAVLGPPEADPDTWDEELRDMAAGKPAPRKDERDMREK